jgi:hypothetical protein
MIAAIILVVLLANGCINVNKELQVPDETVKPILTGEDCVGIYFGIVTGTVQMTEAMKSYHNIQQIVGSERVTVRGGLLIRRIHSVVLKDRGALGFGRRCLEIKGEP